MHENSSSTLLFQKNYGGARASGASSASSCSSTGSTGGGGNGLSALARGSFPVAVKRFTLPPWQQAASDGAGDSARRYAAKDALRRWKVAVNEVMALELIRHEYNRRCLLAVNYGIAHNIEFPTLPLLIGIKDADGELQISMSVIEGIQCLKASSMVIGGSDDASLPVCRLPRTWATPELVARASLRELCQAPHDSNLAFSESSARLVVRDVADSLSLLHGLGMAHRDVKPENVQLFAGKQVDGSIALRAVLLDLGFAFVPDGAEPLSDPAASGCTFLSTLFGTKASAAPEIWKAADAASLAKRSSPVAHDDRLYSEAVDIWGLGVVFYSVLFGSLPFDDSGGVGELKCNILEGKFKIPAGWGSLTPQTRALLVSMFRVDPTERPSAADVLAALRI